MSAPKESAAAVGLMSLFSKPPKDVSPPREMHPNPSPPPGRLPTPAVSPPVPAQRSTSTSVPVPPPAPGLGIPGMIRSTSQPRGVSISAPGGSNPDWRSFVAIEERTHVRSQIREAYKKNCLDYNSLLAVVAAIDEELLFCGATARIDYFKTGIDWESKLALKRKLLAGPQPGGVGTSGTPGVAAPATSGVSNSSLLSTMPVNIVLNTSLSTSNASSSSSTSAISNSKIANIVGGGTSGGKPRSGKGNRKRGNESLSNPQSPVSSSGSVTDNLSAYSAIPKGLSPVDTSQGYGEMVDNPNETFTSQAPFGEHGSPFLHPQSDISLDSNVDSGDVDKKRRRTAAIKSESGVNPNLS